MSDFDDKTLDEIKEHFWDNLEHTLKKSKTINLKDKEDCKRFYKEAIRDIANRHGARIESLDTHEIHDQCLAHNIKIEAKLEKDTWMCRDCGDIQKRQPRNKLNFCSNCLAVGALVLVEQADHRNDGTFIMKYNEIVGFISEPEQVGNRMTAGGLVIINDGRDPKYLMRVMRKA